MTTAVRISLPRCRKNRFLKKLYGRIKVSPPPPPPPKKNKRKWVDLEWEEWHWEKVSEGSRFSSPTHPSFPTPPLTTHSLFLFVLSRTSAPIDDSDSRDWLENVAGTAPAQSPHPYRPRLQQRLFFILFFSFWNVSVLYVTCCHGSGVATRLGGACGMVACPPVSVA